MLRLPRMLIVVGLLACGGTSSEESTTNEQGVHAAPATTCDLGWGEAPASFDGATGTFERASAAPPNGLAAMSFSALAHAPDQITAEADATRTLACSSPPCAIERARAQLVAVNHAMNPMILFSTDGFAIPSPNVTAAYDVLGIERSATGEIAAMCLYDLAAADPPFLVRRR